MSDRGNLKEKIRQAISAEHSCKNNLCDLYDKRSYDRCICESDAAAALTAIEEAGYVIKREAAASAVWDEAVEVCIDAIRQRPVKSGGTAWDEGMNDARIQHIRTLAALKRSENADV